MAYIRPRATAHGKRYDVVWREAGRNRSKSFTRERDAKTFRLELERRLRLGLLYEAPPVTLEAAYEAFISRYEVGRAPSTVACRRQAWPVLAPLAGLPLTQVTLGVAEDCIVAHARRAPRQAQVAAALLKAVLRDAQVRGQRVAPEVLTLHPPAYLEREPRFLTYEELERLCSWCTEPRLVKFAALSGLRQGELFALRDTDVTLAEGGRSKSDGTDPGTPGVRLHGTAVPPSPAPSASAYVLVQRGAYKSAERPTKSKKRRRVYLPGLAASVLREQLLVRPPGTPYVFPAPRGGIWGKDRFMSRVFRPAARRAELEGVTFHDLRHTYASLMVAAGANPLQIAEALGHTDKAGQPDATLVWRRYGHLYPGSSQEAAASLGRYLEEAARG